MTGAVVKGSRATYVEIGSDELLVICPPDSPLADRKGVALADLAEADWVMRERGSGTRQIAEQLLTERGVDPDELRVVVELGTGEAIVSAVEGGLGVAMLSRQVADKALSLGTVAQVDLEGPAIVRPFYTLLPKGTPTRAAEAFAGYLAESVPGYATLSGGAAERTVTRRDERGVPNTTALLVPSLTQSASTGTDSDSGRPIRLPRKPRRSERQGGDWKRPGLPLWKGDPQMHHFQTSPRLRQVAGILLALMLVFAVVGCSTASTEKPATTTETSDVVLASTTSTQDSGLFDVLIPAFEKAYPQYKVKVIAVGSGEAHQAGRDQGRRRAARPLAGRREEVRRGRLRYRAQRRHVQRLRDRRPGGRSGRRQGLDQRDRGDDRDRRGRQGRQGDVRLPRRRLRHQRQGADALGGAEHRTPTPAADKWYLSTGQGMGETLKVADEKGAYTLADRATWLSMKDQLPDLDDPVREGQGAAQPVRRHRDSGCEERGRRPGVRRLRPESRGPEGHRRVRGREVRSALFIPNATSSRLDATGGSMQIFVDAWAEGWALLTSGSIGVWADRLDVPACLGDGHAIALLIGLPVGYFVGAKRFIGRRAALVIFNAGMGLPPMVVGLIVAMTFSRRGPLGDLDLLYTRPAMVIAQLIIAVPVVMAITAAAVSSVPRELTLQARSLGAGGWRVGALTLSEARMGLLAAVAGGFGAIISEVGAVQMVGGNLEGDTRVMTTAIVQFTRRAATDPRSRSPSCSWRIVIFVNIVLTGPADLGRPVGADGR